MGAEDSRLDGANAANSANAAGQPSGPGGENRKAPLPVVVGYRTDVGCVREQNEDSVFAEAPLLVVADGIGGQEAGEIASKIAVDTMRDEAPRTADSDALGDAVMEANRQIMEAARFGRGRPGMGTTMTAAVIDGDQMIVAQVGDSRCYMLRDGELVQLTHDHSLIASLVETGQITEEEARTHPSRSIITRALGSDQYLQPDLFKFELKRGDKVLLCSDGLHGMVSKDEITKVLTSTGHPQRAANRLVELAKRHGGMDNVTVIVANIDSTRPMVAHPDPPKKKRKWSALIFAIVAVALVCAAVGAFGFYIRNSAYLVAEDGYVCLYSGRMDSSGIFEYKELVRNTGISTDDLPELTVTKLEEGIQFDSLDEAESVVEDYEEQVEAANVGETGAGSSGSSSQSYISSGSADSSSDADSSSTDDGE